MLQQHNCYEELHKVNLKATPARLAVLQVLENFADPLDVTGIKKHLEKQHINVDKVTVFRILNFLTQKGLALPIELNEGKLRYEYAKRTDHHHLICQNCGSLEDVTNCNIQSLEKEIQKKKKFIVKRHSLEFFGLCKNCQN